VSLAVSERARLAELERVVDRGLQTFVEVGLALQEIRDGRLYRETHATFEAYLDGRWGMSRSRGYRLIEAAAVAELVSPMGDIPGNERQARELAPVLRDEGEQAVVEVWRELRAEYGDEVTARRVRQVVANRIRRVLRERAKLERAAVDALSGVYGDVEVRHGDFRDALADLAGTVDAIITDPPYERAWIERDAADFAAAASRMLKPSGAAVVMFGQLAQYDLKARLDEHLAHRWTGVYVMPGDRARMFHARVATGWKPLLIYMRKDAPTPDYLLNDVFVSDAADKAHHHWGQSVSGTSALVEAFSRPGGLVVDPFVGGGTTAVVCHELGRRFAGCDVDAGAVQTTLTRLESEAAA
jgi:16S rRNA G966 N2-methylase RsmD